MKINVKVTKQVKENREVGLPIYWLAKTPSMNALNKIDEDLLFTSIELEECCGKKKLNTEYIPNVALDGLGDNVDFLGDLMQFIDEKRPMFKLIDKNQYDSQLLEMTRNQTV